MSNIGQPPNTAPAPARKAGTKLGTLTPADATFLTVIMLLLLGLAAFANTQPRGSGDAATSQSTGQDTVAQEAQAVAGQVSTILAGYTDYGSTPGLIGVSGGTLIVAFGANPVPAFTPATAAVNVTPGVTVEGNMPAGTHTEPVFCLTVTNAGQSAVYTEAGYQELSTGCVDGLPVGQVAPAQ